MQLEAEKMVDQLLESPRQVIQSREYRHNLKQPDGKRLKLSKEVDNQKATE